jgi:hypothetical protein
LPKFRFASALTNSILLYTIQVGPDPREPRASDADPEGIGSWVASFAQSLSEARITTQKPPEMGRYQDLHLVFAQGYLK